MLKHHNNFCIVFIDSITKKVYKVILTLKQKKANHYKKFKLLINIKFIKY